jgi:IS30 family transposase
MEVSSIGNSRYKLVRKDDFSHYSVVYFLKNKFEASEKIQDFITLCKNETGKTVKVLRTDQGTEFLQLRKFLKKSNIKHQTSVAYTPEQKAK